MKLEQISSWDLYDNIKNKLNSSIIKSWLLEEGPITKRIKSSYEFKLKLIQDEITQVIDADKKFLNTNSNEIRVREVVLLGDEKPLVYAQTLIPNSTINKGLAELGKIGNKPLGDILFEKDIFTKKDIVYAQFIFDNNSFWGRKIKYTVKNQPFSVMEVFLIK